MKQLGRAARPAHPAIRALRCAQREGADDGRGGRAVLCRAGRRWLGTGWTGKRCACERVGGSPMLYCRVHHLCECIHEIERSLNVNLYNTVNTDYLFVPRASRASTRGCSPARFLHCAIAPPRGFSAVSVTDNVVKKSRTHRCPLCIFN